MLEQKWIAIKVKSLSRVQLFMTPWTVVHQAPPSMGFSRQEYWSGLPFISPGDLPDPGMGPRSPALQADALTSEPPGLPLGSTKSEIVRNTPPIGAWRDTFIEKSGSKVRKLLIGYIYTCTHIFWLCHEAFEALVPWPGIKPKPCTVKVWSLNHQSARVLIGYISKPSWLFVIGCL